MDFARKQTQSLSYIQLILFISILILAQYKFFMFAFTVLICFILYMAIFTTKNRLFSWVMLAYLVGNLLFLYGDRFIDELPFHTSTLMILSRGLLLIPIGFIMYITRKFNGEVMNYRFKSDWNAKIYFPFVWSGFHSLSIKAFLLVAVSINLVVFSPFIFKANISLNLSFLNFLILFSLINAVLEEILWRGILLTRMVELAGEKAAVLFSGIAFGLSHLAFGYSWLICLGFAFGGFFYAAIVVRSGSIIPAIIWHVVFNILMILSGVIPYYG